MRGLPRTASSGAARRPGVDGNRDEVRLADGNRALPAALSEAHNLLTRRDARQRRKAGDGGGKTPAAKPRGADLTPLSETKTAPPEAGGGTSEGSGCGDRVSQRARKAADINRSPKPRATWTQLGLLRGPTAAFQGLRGPGTLQEGWQRTRSTSGARSDGSQQGWDWSAGRQARCLQRRVAAAGPGRNLLITRAVPRMRLSTVRGGMPELEWHACLIRHQRKPSWCA